MVSRESNWLVSSVMDQEEIRKRVVTIVVNGGDALVDGTSRPAHKFSVAYTTMRRAIVEHELPSLQPLDESWLMEKYELSRTPLREALKRLAYEKFLRWPNHQSPMIRDITIDELSRVHETRMLLEPTIARLAAARASKANIDHILKHLDAITSVSKTNQIYESVEFDLAFHSAVAQASENRFLREASDNLNRQSLRMWFRSQRAHGVRNVDVMHRDLAHAIAEQDEELAEDLAKHHVSRFFERQLDLQRLPQE